MKFFATASELDFQTKRADWLAAEVEKLEQKLALAEAAIKDERKAKDKFILTAMDQISVKAGLFGQFQKQEKPKEVKPPSYSPEMEARIEAAAKLQREADIDGGYDPHPIEWYVNQIKDNPEAFLPH